jgi:hypothetical protein
VMASDWLVRATVASNQKQKLVVATSPLTTQQYRVRTNTKHAFHCIVYIITYRYK